MNPVNVGNKKQLFYYISKASKIMIFDMLKSKVYLDFYFI